MNWEYVRVLPDGETISVDGTHLGESTMDDFAIMGIHPIYGINHSLVFIQSQGHNIPDKHGNRYCINLVSVAGNPK